MLEYPRARHDLEFIPLDHQGQRMILVRDRLELVEPGTGVRPELMPALQLLDGSRSLADLQVELTALQGGEAVTRDDLLAFLSELDAAGLLDSPRYQAKKTTAAAAFAASPVREPAFAGQAYPQDLEELAQALDDILAEAPEVSPGKPPLAVVAPHIDPAAGRSGYAAAYAALRGTRPGRVIVLGVGHQLLQGLFCLTDKAFATPLGNIPADSAAVARLRQAKALVDPDDLPHRAEHSVEFQAIFLRHVLGDAAFSLVPILCGAPQGVLPEYSRQAFLEAAGPFLAALRELAAEPGTLMVAGVDFCHIGLKFGHSKPATHLEAEAMAHDRALLRCLCAGDATGFWAESARVEDGYNVCGFTALATLLESLPPGQGKVLCHDIMREPPTRSAVTFAAAAFTRP